MRKLFMFNLMSLDGYFEGPNRDISWHNVDPEFNEYAVGMLDSADTLVFGRVTYELMAGFWPTAEAMRDDPLVAGRMNRLAKVVFSKTLDRAEWNNTAVARGDAAEELRRMKNQPGKDLVILGSAALVSSLVQHHVIDEYRIMLNPVVLGSGTPLFKHIQEKLKLNHVKTTTFKSGNVLLYYRQ